MIRTIRHHPAAVLIDLAAGIASGLLLPAEVTIPAYAVLVATALWLTRGDEGIPEARMVER